MIKVFPALCKPNYAARIKYFELANLNFLLLRNYS